jgi:photosystem II CP47 chlorophyll apoprotein
MHTSIVSGWAGTMSLYELVVIESTDPVYNPIWRQGSYVLPFISRLGVVNSIFSWSLGIDTAYQTTGSFWSFETVALCHIVISGLLALASCWHWAYWDLDLFIISSSGKLGLDLIRVFGIHLSLASLLCLGFGLIHLTGFSGNSGSWVSDSSGILGTVRGIKPVYSILSLSLYCYGSVPANHISSGFLGALVGIWHISSRPYSTLVGFISAYSIESALSSGLASLLFTSLITASTMWYGSVTSGLELFGPTRYHWDSGYFSVELDQRVKGTSLTLSTQTWEQVPDKLVLYDYIGSNPAKGGLFRSGPMTKGDGLVQNWVGYGSFESGNLSLVVRRMPAFFETFPVILVDPSGTVRADIPFRRAESRYSLEQVGVSVYFSGGILSGTGFSSQPLVKSYARKAQFGQIFTFDKQCVGSDGVFRTSIRGWYFFSHATFSLLFLFGHLWHAGRALFRDLWTGLSITYETLSLIEYGQNERLGSVKSKTSAFL